MNREELGEVVAIMLDVMPGNITDKEIAIIMINFIIQRKRANHWPIINAEIEAGLVEYLISQVEDEISKHGIRITTTCCSTIENLALTSTKELRLRAGAWLEHNTLCSLNIKLRSSSYGRYSLVDMSGDCFYLLGCCFTL